MAMYDVILHTDEEINSGIGNGLSDGMGNNVAEILKFQQVV
jgi:hypothetical protein